MKNVELRMKNVESRIKNEVIDFKLANSFSHSSFSHNVLKS